MVPLKPVFGHVSGPYPFLILSTKVGCVSMLTAVSEIVEETQKAEDGDVDDAQSENTAFDIVSRRFYKFLTWDIFAEACTISIHRLLEHLASWGGAADRTLKALTANYTEVVKSDAAAGKNRIETCVRSVVVTAWACTLQHVASMLFGFFSDFIETRKSSNNKNEGDNDDAATSAAQPVKRVTTCITAIGGEAIGAALGTLFVPGVGTAVGGLIGGSIPYLL